MNVNYLISFIETVKNKSFSKAARNLYITQPAITMHIKNLEKDLNVKLIDRSNRKFSLTKEGEILFEQSKHIVNMVNETKEKINHSLDESNSLVRIHASSVPYQYVIPSLVINFSKENPNVKFDVVKSNSGNLIDLVAKGVINFALVGEKVENDALVFHKIVEDEIVFVTSDRIDGDVIEAVKSKPLIKREEGSATQAYIDAYMEEIGINLEQLNYKYIIHDNDVLLELVRAGLANCMVSNLIKDDVLHRYSLGTESLKRNIYLVVSKDRYLSMAERKFIEEITR